MTHNDYTNRKECSKLCSMVGCGYYCFQPKTNEINEIKTLFRCNDITCSQVFINFNDYKNHRENHIEYITKVLTIIAEEETNIKNYNFYNE